MNIGAAGEAGPAHRAGFRMLPNERLTQESQQGTEPLHRAILAVDIEGFGRQDRTDPMRVHLRDRLHALLADALATAGIPPEQLEQRSDLGDGLLVIADPQVSVARLLHPLIPRLEAELATQNRHNTGATRLRLRVAIHSGQILADTHGHTGAALIHTFRLLDAEAVRTALRSVPAADLVVVVSDLVWQSIVAQRYPRIDPEGFQPVRIHAKETRMRAWVHLAGCTEQPRLPEVLGASAGDPAVVVVPRELPPAAPHFTGRRAELARLRALVPQGDKETVVISAIAGMAGVGKTVLALNLAHELTPRFPDAQLYVNLQGHDAHQRLSPSQALDRFLRALGVTGEALPAALDEQAALYRSLLAGKHALVVLDNAYSADQVRPLLPGSPTCLALVTSRDRLRGLIAHEGASLVMLDVLSSEDATDLLARVAGHDGHDRVRAEPEAAAEVARLCGCLPLALSIAGATLATRPTMSIATMVTGLTDECRRLDGEVRASFAFSYERLDPAMARLFRRLSLVAGPDFAPGMAAALTGAAPHEAEELLEALIDIHLLETASTPGRYRFHDLLRLYAQERVQADETGPDRDAAVRRMLIWYRDNATAADQALIPARRGLLRERAGDWLEPISPKPTEALAWLDAEWANLMAAARQAAIAGLHEIAWQIPDALYSFASLRRRWTDWRDACLVGRAAARQAHDPQGEAWMLTGVGIACRRLRRFDEAIDRLQEALKIHRELGDRRGEAWAVGYLGLAHRDLRHFDEAIDSFQKALAIDREVGHRYGEAWDLHDLGDLYRRLRRFDEAIDRLQEALKIHQELGDRRGEAWAVGYLGIAHCDQGRFEEAIDYLQQALAIARQVGHRYGEALALRILGTAFTGVRRFEEAIDCHQRALAIDRETGDRFSEGWTLDCLGLTLQHARGIDAARACWLEALSIFTEIGVPEAERVRIRLESTPACCRQESFHLLPLQRVGMVPEQTETLGPSMPCPEKARPGRVRSVHAR